MQDATLSALIGVGFGAITASIPKLWDLFFENKKHRQLKDKLYFESKLKVLQAYVATITQLSASNFHNAIIMRKLKEIDFFNNADDFEEAIIKNLETHNNKALKLVDQLSETSSAASMFVDLKDNVSESYVLIESIHNDISKIGKVMGNVFDAISKHGLIKEPVESEIGAYEYFQVKNLYKDHMQKIADNYEKVKDMMNMYIRDVREDIKNYK